MTVKEKMVPARKPGTKADRIPLRCFIGDSSWEEIFKYPNWTGEELRILKDLHEAQIDKILLWSNKEMNRKMPRNWRQVIIDINTKFIEKRMIFRIHFWEDVGWGLLRTIA